MIRGGDIRLLRTDIGLAEKVILILLTGCTAKIRYCATSSWTAESHGVSHLLSLVDYMLLVALIYAQDLRPEYITVLLSNWQEFGLAML